MNRKVSFPGHGVFWFLEEPEGSGRGPLAPLGHCDENGNVSLEAAFFEDSYAQVGWDGLIRRFHEVIGKREDLIFWCDGEHC